MASYADPSTTAYYDEPYGGAMRRGFLESASALAKQPMPIPVRQYAGLDPYEMQARAMAGGLGGFTPYLQQGANMAQQGFGTMQQGAGALPMAQQMYGQGAGMYGQATGMAGQAANMYAPGAAQQFYNPYENQVVQQTMRDMQDQNAMQGQADRARAVSSGAFGSSRGRLMEQEREKAFGRGMMDAVGGLRQQGFQQAQQMAQGAGQGLGQISGRLGQFGQGLGALGQGITSMAGQYGQLGRNMGQMGTGFANLGMTGQTGLMNQINRFDKLGQAGRGIQNQMYGAQYDAANKMAMEPWKRMQAYQGMLEPMLPQGSSTTYGSQAGGGVADLMRMFGMI